MHEAIVGDLCAAEKQKLEAGERIEVLQASARDLSVAGVMAKHVTLNELETGLSDIRRSPKDVGVLRAIVIRPKTDERVTLNECEISAELGVHGDNWAQGCWLSLPDGRPHPDVQVAIMNARTIELIAQDPKRWQLAGDNLYVDIDLSDDNVPRGQRLKIGSAVLEITAEAHNGCQKFAERYGTDAVRFVNSNYGKKLHLRGIYAKIIQAGVIHVGDEITKL